MQHIKTAVLDQLVAAGWLNIDRAPFTGIALREFETAAAPREAVLYWYAADDGCTLIGQYWSEGRNVLAPIGETFRADDDIEAVRDRLTRFLLQAQRAIDGSYARRLHLRAALAAA